MAGGWTRDGAVLDQIEDTVTDGVLTARARMPVGEGTRDCVECGEPIPDARRRALPSARTCIDCSRDATAAWSSSASTGGAARIVNCAEPWISASDREPDAIDPR